MALRLVVHQVLFLEFIACLFLLNLSGSVCEATSTLSMQNASLTVNEGDTVDVCVVASSFGINSTAQVEVMFAMEMGSSDLTLLRGDMLSFNMTNGMMQTICLPVTAAEDNIFEDTENFTLSLSTNTGGVSIVNPSSTTVSIIDDDDVTVTMRDSMVEVEEGSTTQVCAVLTGHIERNIVVEISTTTTDSGVRAADLSIPTSNMLSFDVTIEEVMQIKCLTVTAVNDDIFEDTEAFTLSLTSTTAGALLGEPSNTVVSITDDDDVTVTMKESVVEVAEGTTAQVCAVLTGHLERNVVVEISTTTTNSEADLSLPTSNMLTFDVTIEEVMQMKCLTVTPVKDDIFEDTETFTLSLTSTTAGALLGEPSNTAVSITDDDDVTVNMRDIKIEVVEGRTANICAVLTGQLERNVVVEFSTSSTAEVFKAAVSGIDYQTTSEMKTFNMENTLQCLEVITHSDEVFEYWERFNVTVTIVNPNSPDKIRGTMRITKVVIQDFDSASIIMRNSSIIQRESDGNVEVCAQLSSPIEREVTVEMSSATLDLAELAFPSSSEVGSTQCLSFTISDDSNFENSPILSDTVTLSSDQERVTASGETTVTVNDDDVMVSLLPEGTIDLHEGDDDLDVCARISSPPDGLRETVIVQLSINGEQTDKIFPIGTSHGSTECVTLLVANDNQVFENSTRKTYMVTLRSIQPTLTVIGTSIVNVNDNDSPVIGLQQTSYTFNESTPEVNASICVVLKSPTGGLAIPFEVIFSVSPGTAAEGSDYSAFMHQDRVEFTTSDEVEATKCIAVKIVDDDVGEAEEEFWVHIRSPNLRVSISVGATAVIIVDNEVFPAPLNLMANSIDSRSLELSWDPPDTSSTEVMLTGYIVICNGNQVGNSVSASTTNLVVNNLLPYTTYTCTVDANFVGNSIGQSTVTETTFEEVPGSAPLRIGKTSSTTSSITLSWSPPVASHGVITHYTLYVGYNNVSNFNTNSTENIYTISPLSPYQTVSVRISASTSVGEGPLSMSVDFTSDELISGPVGNLTANKVNDTSFTIQWMEPIRLNGVLSKYIVNITSDEDLQELTTTKQSITVSNLAPYIPYKITVSAVNGAGVGEYQKVFAFTTEGVPVSHPRNVITNRINDTSALITWTPLSLTEARGFITYYNLTYWTVGSDISDSESTIVPGDENSTIISGLDPDSRYNFVVSANTVVGESNFSEPIILSKFITVDQVTVIAGVAVVLVVAVVVLILGVIICIGCMSKRRRKPKSKPQPPPKPKQILSFELENRAVIEDFDLNNDDQIDTSSLLSDQNSSLKDIPVTEFSKHVKQLHKKTDQGFEEEYKSIKDGNHSWSEGVKPYNKTRKNRFINIFPFDYCRVKLEYTGNPGSDYINASWLNGYNRNDAYIAAQGPLPDTIEDFWRMIWDNRLPTIVMVTKLIEGGREKCEQYWPSKSDEFMKPCLNLIVTLKETKPFADYEIRILTVKNVAEPDIPPFQVTHCFYQGWPDHGVPEYATSVLGFLKRVRKSHPCSGPPLLVHCSAGVGRTGTFIVLDTMLQMINQERAVNVYKFVKELRERRCQTVQTMSQYVFIHDALDELITCGDTEIAAVNLFIAMNQLRSISLGKSLSGYEEQFELLHRVSRKPSEKDQENVDLIGAAIKNRYPNKIPYIAHSPKLIGSTKLEQYINASYIDGYKQRKCFVATQAPLDNTVVDFWKMTWKLESRTVVMLCNLQENGQETCSQYWPEGVGESEVYGKLTVRLLSEEVNKGITRRRLEVSTRVQVTNKDSYLLTLFHHTSWNETGPQPSASSVLHLNGLVVNSQKSTGNKPIIVMCNDGCGRSGTFLSVYSQIDRFKVEAVVDVFQCVKSTRIQRMDLVSTVEQYELIHEVIKQYMMSFDEYANFNKIL